MTTPVERPGHAADRRAARPCPPPLRTTSLQLGDETILILAGEIDLATAGDVTAAAATCLGHGPTLLSIDVGSVEFCDCAGLRALHLAKAWAHTTGAAFQLLSIDAATRRLLVWSNAEDLLAATRAPVPPGATDPGSPDPDPDPADSQPR